MPASKTSGKRQIAALPWRLAGGGIEVLLVTSRETRRWVIPKGWPMSGHSKHQSAAIEAFEEAGVKGAVSAKSVGSFSYRKRLSEKRGVDLTVDVFPLRVKEQAAAWPEKTERTARWFHSTEAARLVQEPELAALIAAFAAGGFMRCA